MSEFIVDHPWSSESLYIKASMYVDKMELASTNDEWDYGLWSSLCLEFLVRAALANISPVYLADLKNWQNISYALGRSVTEPKFYPRSIATSDVLNRLKTFYPEFIEIHDFCLSHISRRNSELHTGDSPFMIIRTSEWLPDFYKAIKILLDLMGKSLSDFIDGSEKALEMIASLEDKDANSIKNDISAYKKVWNNLTDVEKEAKVAQVNTWATRNHGHRVVCPSCSSTALVRGSAVGPINTSHDGEDNIIIQRQKMIPGSFECIACGLKISGYAKLKACNLGDIFTATYTFTPSEFYELYTEEEARERFSDNPYEFEPDFNDY